jgi:hypothetical protein
MELNFALLVAIGQPMEKEALVLRARAELANIQAEYAANEAERHILSDRALAYNAQAKALEELLLGRVHQYYPAKMVRRPKLALAS